MRNAPLPPSDLATAATGGFIGTLRARVFLGPMAGPTPPRAEKPAHPSRKPTPSPIIPTSIRGKLCVALGVLHEAFPDARDFLLSDLVLAAWRMWPQTFGLVGHKALAPCSNTVTSKLSGDGSPVARKVIRRTSRGRVALTAAGRRWYATFGIPTLPAQRPQPLPTPAGGPTR